MTEQEQKAPEKEPAQPETTTPPVRGRHRFAMALLVLLIATAALAGAGVRRAHVYVTTSPSFCLSCHGQVTGELAGHPHKDLNCGACHRTEFVAGLKLLVSPVKGKAKQHGAVDLGRCKSCHFDEKRDSKTARSIGHQNHVTAKVQISCDRCHSLNGHKTPVNTMACGGCHDKVTVHEHGMNQVACLSCHQFIKEGKAGDPGATGCPTCHAGKPLQPGQSFTATKTKPITAAVVHGNVNACRLCHEPHRPDPANRRHGSDCASCHRRVVEQHIEAKIPAHANCGECHDVHGPRPKTPDLCVRCHSNALTKPSDAKLSARHAGCAGCHGAHRFRAEAARCIACHEPVRTQLASWNAKAHSDCLACHSGHSNKTASAACPACHQAERGHGHSSCTLCHEPHKDKSAAKSCNACHQPVFQALLTVKNPQHRACGSCHGTHSAPQASTQCVKCHAKQGELAARASMPAHRACGSCHVAHQFASSGAACRNCHRPADLGAHRDGCLKCHQAHGPPGRPQLECNSCHAGVHPSAGRHAECASCHAVHKQANAGPACVTCHQSKVAAANTWRPTQHQKCSSCHQLHSEQPPKSCDSCHREQASRALAKGHSCQGCHNPHQSPTLSSALCAGCHQAQAAKVRGSTATHSDCVKCHQPHDAVRPTCEGCHKTKPFAHALPGHQRCADCHATHQVAFRGRDKCLSCHKDKTNHYPKAATCLSCHNFR